MPKKSYEELCKEVQRLQDEAKLPRRPDRDQMIDWAYGNTVIENEDITVDMVEKAVDEKLRT